MTNILTYSNIPMLLALLVGMIGLIMVFVLIGLQVNKEKETKDFLKQLREIEKQTKGEQTKKNKIANNGLFTYIKKTFGEDVAKSGLLGKDTTETQALQLVFIGSIIVYAVFCLMGKNLGIGIIPMAVGLMLVRIVVTNTLEEKQRLFEEQIPNFLTILKSNIQAGDTPERALINAIDETDNPLYEELKVAKELSLAGSFRTALATLRNTTTDETLRFLCSCIEISSSIGSNLEEQIVVIEEILNNKRAIKRKLNIAIAENTPLLYVSMMIIPFIFIYTYLVNETTRNFWFHNLLSWCLFFVAILAYGLGVFFSNKIIKNTSKF